MKSQENANLISASALAAADRNMDRLMVDELREELEQAKKSVANKDQALANQKQALADKDQALSKQKQALSDALSDVRKLQEELRLLKEKK